MRFLEGLFLAALAVALTPAGSAQSTTAERPRSPSHLAGPARVGSIYAAAPWWWGLEAPSVALFRAELGRWGQWRTLPGWGQVWVPRAAPGWRPYLFGGFVEDPRLGWRWVSEEPFGWAVYHYGRWGFDPRLGWFWVPGRTFAGHWAELRLGIGWFGWAPLPPPGWGRWGRGHAVWLDWGYPGWVFAVWPARPHWIAPRPGWRPHPDQMARWRQAPVGVHPAPRPPGVTRPGPAVARATLRAPDEAVQASPIELVEPEAFPGRAPVERSASRTGRETPDGRATEAATRRRDQWQGSWGEAAGSADDGAGLGETLGAGATLAPGWRARRDLSAAQPPPAWSSPVAGAAPASAASSALGPAITATPASEPGPAYGGRAPAHGMGAVVERSAGGDRGDGSMRRGEEMRSGRPYRERGITVERIAEQEP